jgi:hypothetical protein
MDISFLGAYADYLYTAITILLAGHGLAIAIVNLTATPADDAVVATVYSWIEKAAGIITPKAKQ